MSKYENSNVLINTSASYTEYNLKMNKSSFKFVLGTMRIPSHSTQHKHKTSSKTF